MIKLILKLKETQMDEFNLEKSIVHIGRSQENDIVIDNVAVSRRHAQLELKEGGTAVTSPTAGDFSPAGR